jgi:hypothetical protein
LKVTHIEAEYSGIQRDRSMANSTLPTLAVAAMIVASAPTTGWADDQAQAEACQKTLGLFAANKIDEAVDTMFFEAQPWDGQKAQEMRGHATYEKAADAMRDTFRRAIEHLLKANDATAVRYRGPVSRLTLAGRIVHLEQWQFDNGRKIYAGCVRRPSSDASGWRTDIKVNRDKAKLLKDLEDSIRRAATQPAP